MSLCQSHSKGQKIRRNLKKLTTIKGAKKFLRVILINVAKL